MCPALVLKGFTGGRGGKSASAYTRCKASAGGVQTVAVGSGGGIKIGAAGAEGSDRSAGGRVADVDEGGRKAGFRRLMETVTIRSWRRMSNVLSPLCRTVKGLT